MRDFPRIFGVQWFARNQPEYISYWASQYMTKKYLLGQWSEYKFSFKHQGVRNFESGVIDHSVTIEQDVKVDVSWSLVHNLYPAGILFD